MGTRVKFTALQGSNLMQLANARGGFPEKLGETTKFNENTRATFNHEIRLFVKALKKADISPLYAKSRKMLFGPEEWWARKVTKPGVSEEMDLTADDGERYTLKPECRELVQEVDLTGKARNGLFRLLLLMCHPGSPFCLGGGAQDDVVWAIAEQVPGGSNALLKATGADKGETVDLGLDDEPAKDEAKDE